jgi:hypothetical protein
VIKPTPKEYTNIREEIPKTGKICKKQGHNKWKRFAKGLKKKRLFKKSTPIPSL